MPLPTDLKVLELDLGCYELRLNGDVVRLEKIPMELFIFLVENRDKVVSREAIVEHIWGKDVFLDTEQGINTAIRKIRQALHEDPDQPRFLHTVFGKGYRFVGVIKVVGDGSSSVSVPQPQSSSSVIERDPAENLSRGVRWWRSKAVLGTLGALILMAQ